MKIEKINHNTYLTTLSTSDLQKKSITADSFMADSTPAKNLIKEIKNNIINTYSLKSSLKNSYTYFKKDTFYIYFRTKSEYYQFNSNQDFNDFCKFIKNTKFNKFFCFNKEKNEILLESNIPEEFFNLLDEFLD